MVVLCIGDSSGLPRPGLPYIQTWPYLLKKRFAECDLIPLFKRSCTTGCLLEEGDYLEYYSPNLVIIQLGIVDCAPRYIKNSRILYKVVKKLPLSLQTIFWKFWKLTHKRRTKEAYVSTIEFKNNLVNYLDRCMKSGVESVIIIKIATPSQRILDDSPIITDAVKTYNLIYEELGNNYQFLKLINPLSGEERLCFEDGYHPNIEGNMKILSDLEQVFIKNKLSHI